MPARVRITARVALAVCDQIRRARGILLGANLVGVVVHVSIAHWRGGTAFPCQQESCRLGRGVDSWRARVDALGAEQFETVCLVPLADVVSVVEEIQPHAFVPCHV